MRYYRLKKNLPQLLSLTGLNLEAFEEFLFYFEQDWTSYISHFILQGKPRMRLSSVNVCKHLPTTADKLVFILSYLKNNPLQEFHAATFGMTQRQSNLLIHLFSDILLKTLKRLGELPEENHLRLVHAFRPYTDVFLDGTERPIQRSQDEELQRECFSGKKKALFKK